MENSNASLLSESEIKIYRDIYADANYALLGYKGRNNGKRAGIIMCPYHKPNLIVRIFRRMFEQFKYTFVKRSEPVEL